MENGVENALKMPLKQTYAVSEAMLFFCPKITCINNTSPYIHIVFSDIYISSENVALNEQRLFQNEFDKVLKQNLPASL